MTKDNYSIYKHTSPSGKSYIGITKQGKKRFGKDGNGYKKQRKFYNAIQKYGWDNFKHEIIEDNLSFEQACFGEQLYIEIYDSINNGYNIAIGGEGVQEIGNRKVVQFSQDLKPVNIIKSVSYCSNIVGFKSITTISNWCYDGKLHCGYYWKFLDECENVKIDYDLFDDVMVNYNYLNFNPYSDKEEKIHNSQKGKRSNSKRKINQYAMDGTYIRTWDSIIDSVTYYMMPNDSTIIRAIKNKYNCFGYRWTYYDGSIADILPNITKNKKILQFDINEVFINKYNNSIQAEKETGISRKNITRACSGGRKTAGGYIWRYEENMSDEDLDKALAELSE